MSDQESKVDSAFFFGSCGRRPMSQLEGRATANMSDIHIYKSLSTDGARDELRNQRGKVVEVWGADTFACVGSAIFILIVEGGVEYVWLDLMHVREYETDPDSDAESEMYARAISLLDNVLDTNSGRSLSDTQLALIKIEQSQEEIWNRAIKDHKRRRDQVANQSSLCSWLKRK